MSIKQNGVNYNPSVTPRIRCSGVLVLTKASGYKVLYTGINTDILISQEIKNISELLFIQKVFVLPRPPEYFPNVFS